MISTRRMRDMTGPEASGVVPLIVPLGATEQHGPHLPVDTDAFIAESMAAVVAERLSGLVAPTVAYGCRSQPISGGGETFPGTLSMSGSGYSALIADIVLAASHAGHDRVVFLNGHFENTAFAIEGATVARERGASARIVVINWWEVLSLASMHEIFDGDFPGWEAEHAGVIETSLLLCLAPERVRQELISEHVATVTPPPYTVIPERAEYVDRSGVLRTAHGSTAAIGERVFAAAVDAMTGFLADELDLEVRA